MIWRRGQKVVCVAAQWVIATARVPKKGSVYTIEEIGDCGSAGVFFALSEFDREIGWHSSGFRPLIERRTDISVFEKLLDRPPAAPAREDSPRELETVGAAVRRDVGACAMARAAGGGCEALTAAIARGFLALDRARGGAA